MEELYTKFQKKRCRIKHKDQSCPCAGWCAATYSFFELQLKRLALILTPRQISTLSGERAIIKRSCFFCFFFLWKLFFWNGSSPISLCCCHCLQPWQQLKTSQSLRQVNISRYLSQATITLREVGSGSGLRLPHAHPHSMSKNHIHAWTFILLTPAAPAGPSVAARVSSCSEIVLWEFEFNTVWPLVRYKGIFNYNSLMYRL